MKSWTNQRALRMALGLAVTALPFTSAAGQPPLDWPPCSEVVLSEFGRGEKITIITKDDSYLQGKIETIDRQKALLKLRVYDKGTSRFSSQDVLAFDIEEIWVEKHPREPFYAGMVIGAMALGVSGGSAASEFEGLAVIGGVAIGAFLGVVVGGIISSTMASNEPVHCIGVLDGATASYSVFRKQRTVPTSAKERDR